MGNLKRICHLGDLGINGDVLRKLRSVDVD
jgi:hypothetical protein